MKSTFQRRLTIAMGVLVAAAIVIMAALVAWNAVGNILDHYEDMTVSYSALATRYVRDKAALHEEELRRATESVMVAKVALADTLRASGSIPPGQSWDAFSALLDRSLQNLLETILPPYSLQDTVNDVAGRLNVSRALVVDAEGRVQAWTGFPAPSGKPEIAPEIVAMTRRAATGSGQALPRHVGREIGVATRLDLPDGEVYGFYLQHRMERGIELLRNTVFYIAVFTLVLVAVAMVVAARVSRQFARPIDELARGMREIGDGNLEFQLEVKTRDEIQEVAQAVGNVVGSLRTAMDELEQETLRRELLEHELHIAAELQLALLPKAPPQMEGLDLLGWSRPAKEVGGDFYDFLELGPGRLAVAIGDATGKGLPAALLVTECWSILRTLTDETQSPGELLARTNRVLNRRVQATGRFVTLFLMVVDLHRGTLTYAGAGHNPPLLVGMRSGRRMRLQARDGFPLGIVPGAYFSEHELALDPGDTLLLYSDGLTEAQNAEGEIFGEGRVEDMMTTLARRPLLELLAGVKQGMDDHIRDMEIHDDVTLVGARFRPEAVSAVVGAQ